MMVENRRLHRELAREPDVVDVKESEVFAPAFGDTDVARRRPAVASAVRLTEIPDALGLRGCERSRPLGAAWSGTVVDQEPLPVGIRLAEYARDGVVKEAQAIVERRHDRDELRHGRDNIR